MNHLIFFSNKHFEISYFFQENIPTFRKLLAKVTMSGNIQPSKPQKKHAVKTANVNVLRTLDAMVVHGMQEQAPKNLPDHLVHGSRKVTYIFILIPESCYVIVLGNTCIIQVNLIKSTYSFRGWLLEQATWCKLWLLGQNWWMCMGPGVDEKKLQEKLWLLRYYIKYK